MHMECPNEEQLECIVSPSMQTIGQSHTDLTSLSMHTHRSKPGVQNPQELVMCYLAFCWYCQISKNSTLHGRRIDNWYDFLLLECFLCILKVLYNRCTLITGANLDFEAIPDIQVCPNCSMLTDCVYTKTQTCLHQRRKRALTVSSGMPLAACSAA